MRSSDNFAVEGSVPQGSVYVKNFTNKIKDFKFLYKKTRIYLHFFSETHAEPDFVINSSDEPSDERLDSAIIKLDGNLTVSKEFLNFFININKLSGGLVADNDLKKSVMQQNIILFLVVQVIHKHFLLPISTTKM